MWIIFVYVMLSLILSISAAMRSGLWIGVAFAVGSVLAVAAGGGFRASLLGPNKQKLIGGLITVGILAVAAWVGTHFSAQLFGVFVSGPLWVGIGFIVCFLFVDKKMLQ